MAEAETTKTFEAMIAALKADAKIDAKKEMIQHLGDILIDWLQKQGYTPESKPPMPARKPRGRPPKPKTQKSKIGQLPRAGSDMAKVLDTIRKHPGNRGFQIVGLLAQAGTVVNERTLRTALRRLRSREFIQQRDDGGWYPKS